MALYKIILLVILVMFGGPDERPETKGSVAGVKEAAKVYGAEVYRAYTDPTPEQKAQQAVVSEVLTNRESNLRLSKLLGFYQLREKMKAKIEAMILPKNKK